MKPKVLKILKTTLRKLYIKYKLLLNCAKKDVAPKHFFGNKSAAGGIRTLDFRGRKNRS